MSLRLTSLVGFVLFCAQLQAQNAASTITGIMTDPGGAAVVGARVTVANTGTGVASEMVTGDDGFYRVLNLPIGTYAVSNEQKGFAKTVTDAAEPEFNQNLRADVPPRPGNVTQNVPARLLRICRRVLVNSYYV